MVQSFVNMFSYRAHSALKKGEISLKIGKNALRDSKKSVVLHLLSKR